MKSTEQVLREALEKMIISHENLYKSCFGENSDPQLDCIRREAQEALALPQSLQVGREAIEKILNDHKTHFLHYHDKEGRTTDGKAVFEYQFQFVIEKIMALIAPTQEKKI